MRWVNRVKNNKRWDRRVEEGNIGEDTKVGWIGEEVKSNELGVMTILVGEIDTTYDLS